MRPRFKKRITQIVWEIELGRLNWKIELWEIELEPAQAHKNLLLTHPSYNREAKIQEKNHANCLGD